MAKDILDMSNEDYVKLNEILDRRINNTKNLDEYNELALKYIESNRDF